MVEVLDCVGVWDHDWDVVRGGLEKVIAKTMNILFSVTDSTLDIQPDLTFISIGIENHNSFYPTPMWRRRTHILVGMKGEIMCCVFLSNVVFVQQGLAMHGVAFCRVCRRII